VPPFDLTTYSTEQLVQLLAHPNKWYRQQAIRLFGDRKNHKAQAQLTDLLKRESAQLSLEALWALNISGVFNPEIARIGLLHRDPYVRMWTVRLLGDRGMVFPEVVETFIKMVSDESHPEVISQLACSARRLPASQSIPIIRLLIQLPGVADDPDNPMLTWWAIESKLDDDAEMIIDLLEDQKTWALPVMQTTVLERLSNRLIADGTDTGFKHCARVLSLAPDENYLEPFLDGIYEGLHGKNLAVLPGYLNEAIRPYWKQFGEAPLSFDIQQNDGEAIESALLIISDEQADVGERLAYIKLMGSLQIEQSKPVLLKLVERQSDRVSIRQASLAALANFQDQEIGERVAASYPDKLRADPALRIASLNLMVTRSGWAHQLISLIEQTKQVNPGDVPPQVVKQLQLLENDRINEAVARIWPASKAVSTQEKQATMKRINQAVTSGTAELAAGRQLYHQLCGNCHMLFDEGGHLGPDLTGYDRKNLNYLMVNIVDPNINIREGFVNYKITTSDERTLAGTISNRSSELIVLRSFGGEELTIPSDRIKQIEAQPVSLMPERLVDHLTDQQLRNLFGYIMKNENL
jgi:putative heme-binding domain-containing protein